MSRLTRAAEQAINDFVAAAEATFAEIDRAAIEQEVFDEGSDYETVLLGKVLHTDAAQQALGAFAREYAMDPFEYANADEYDETAARTWREAMDEYRTAVVADPSVRGSFRERWENRFSDAVLDNRNDFLEGASVLSEHDNALRGSLYRRLGEMLSGLTDTYITPDEIAQALEDPLRQAIEQESGGNPLVLLERCNGLVEFSYTPGWGVMPDGSIGYLDDVFTSHQSNCSQVDTLIWDRNLAPVFTLFNMAPQDFLDYLRESYFVSTQASPKEKREAAAAIEAAMQGEFLAAVAHDPARPALCTPSTLRAIFDNASYGGVACLTGKIAIRDLYKWDEDRPAMISNDHHSWVMAGIHDPINGSGHLEGFQGDFLLPPGSLLQCRLSGKEGYERGKPRNIGTDEVYGFANWRITLEQAPAPVKQPEAEGMTP